jgi:hypothetical protein
MDMVLLEPDKSRVRTHLQVPVLGVQDSGVALGYRFANVMGLLERRMNTLQPHEYARITGTPTGAMQILSNGLPNIGDTLSVTVNALPAVVYAVTASDLSAHDPVLSAATNFAAKVIQTIGTTVLAFSQPAVVFPVTTFGSGPAAWQVAFSGAVPGATFTIATSGTGNLTAFPILQGVLPSPSVTFQEDGTIATGYLQICDYLEGKMATSSDLMKFSVAGGTSLRADETQVREMLYMRWCKRLATYFGVPVRPMQAVGRFGGANTGLTV